MIPSLNIKVYCCNRFKNYDSITILVLYSYFLSYKDERKKKKNMKKILKSIKFIKRLKNLKEKKTRWNMHNGTKKRKPTPRKKKKKRGLSQYKTFTNQRHTNCLFFFSFCVQIQLVVRSLYWITTTIITINRIIEGNKL